MVGDPTAVPGTEAGGDPSERRRRRPVARIVVGVYVVIAIVVIAVGVFAGRLDQGTADRAVAVDATTTAVGMPVLRVSSSSRTARAPPASVYSLRTTRGRRPCRRIAAR